MAHVSGHSSQSEKFYPQIAEYDSLQRSFYLHLSGFSNLSLDSKVSEDYPREFLFAFSIDKSQNYDNFRKR